MRMVLYTGLVIALLVVLPVSQTHAGDGSHSFGAGVFTNRSVPIMGLGDRYPASQKYGVVLDYRLSSRATLEMEYHHTKMTNGTIENRAFQWGVDKNQYYSPEARSSFNLDSFLMNALVNLSEGVGSDLKLVPYLAIGVGFYDYQDRISGLIYPGQQVKPLDPDLLIEPREDEHTALGANFGLGMTVAQGRFGLDLRARYHAVLGDLRPMEAWDLESVFPISLLDLRTTFKVYFR